MNAILFRTTSILRLSLLCPVLVAFLFGLQLASVFGEDEGNDSAAPKEQLPVWALDAGWPDHGIQREDASLNVDLTGTYFGTSWGTVMLKKTEKGSYEGTYSDTYSKDVGRIKLQWSTKSMRFEGTWGEGDHRGGKISIRVLPDGKSIRGAWTTREDCKIRPGIPSLADLEWKPVPGVGKLPRLKVEHSDF